jgi:hypothetical protein
VLSPHLVGKMVISDHSASESPEVYTTGAGPFERAYHNIKASL